MSPTDGHGPIDYLVLEFPASARGDASAQALLDLLDAGTVRLYDLLVVSKDADGTVTEVDPTSPAGALDGWSVFAGARSGLLGPEDLALAAGVLDPGTVGAVVVFENAWAAPFVAAARAERGEPIGSARLTVAELTAALDTAEPPT